TVVRSTQSTVRAGSLAAPTATDDRQSPHAPSYTTVSLPGSRPVTRLRSHGPGANARLAMIIAIANSYNPIVAAIPTCSAIVSETIRGLSGRTQTSSG